MMDLHPLRSRHIASLLAAQLQTRFFPDPKHFSDRVDRLNACGVAVLIEKRVARDFDCIGQSDCSVGIMF